MASEAEAADGVVVMGRVLAPYGVKGWLRIRPYTADVGALLRHPAWRLRGAGGTAWRTVALAEGKAHADVVVARLDGVETREAALALRGTEIGVPRAELPPAADDEVYLADLVGLAVVNREGVALGRVAEVQEFGAHPVLRVAVVGGEGERRTERLIPFVPAFVDGVDLVERRIDVAWGEDY